MPAALLYERYKRVGVRREGKLCRAILFLFEFGYLLIDSGGWVGRPAMALGCGQEFPQEQIRLHAGLDLLKYGAFNRIRKDGLTGETVTFLEPVVLSVRDPHLAVFGVQEAG